MWVVFLVLALVLALVLTLMVIGVRYVRDYWKYLEVPHEPPKTLLEILKTLFVHGDMSDCEFEREHYEKLYWRFKGTGPFCGFYHVLQPRVLVLEHELVKQILIKDFSNFNDRGIYHNCKYDPLSGDLYSLHGEYWKEMRMKLDPIFYKHQMHTLFASVYENSENLLNSFELALDDSTCEGLVEVKYLIRRYVLATIAHCVFGLNATQEEKYSFYEFEAMTQLALTTRRHCDFVYWLLYRHPALGRRFRIAPTTQKVQTYFLTLMADMVSQREKLGSPKPQKDYLQLLIDIKTQELSTHETEKDSDAKTLKEHLTNELAAHAFSFLKAGYEPTARTLAYVLYELAVNPIEQERLRLEIAEVLNEQDAELNSENVLQLKYMGKVISETLRLHPINPYLIRRALNEYRVPYCTKYLIPKNSCVVIPTHAIHNDPANFPQPHLFDPERFNAQANKQRDQCEWLGFGDGPRNCIGLHFAQLQMRIALARLLRKFQFSFNAEQIMINSNSGGVILQVKRIDDAT